MSYNILCLRQKKLFTDPFVWQLRRDRPQWKLPKSEKKRKALKFFSTREQSFKRSMVSHDLL